MKVLCKIFGHKWRCYMAIRSYCSRCGITYTEYLKQIKKEKQK